MIDDIASTQPWRVRFLEIRGRAEAVPGHGDADPAPDASVIRLHPGRVLSFGIEEPPEEPHRTPPAFPHPGLKGPRSRGHKWRPAVVVNGRHVVYRGAHQGRRAARRRAQVV